MTVQTGALEQAEQIAATAEHEHTAALGALLELERRHDRAMTDWGRTRLRQRIEPAWVRAQKARAEYRDAMLNLAMHQWATAMAHAEQKRLDLIEAREAKAEPEELVRRSAEVDAAIDAVATAQREVAMWKPKP